MITNRFIIAVLAYCSFLVVIADARSLCFDTDFEFEIFDALAAAHREGRSASAFPRIYVYPDLDLFQPPEVAPRPSVHNVLGKWECMYTSEILFLKSVLSSRHLTTDPSEADLFAVPIFPTWMAHRYFRKTLHGSLADILMKTFSYVRKRYPYFNRTRGIDHLWFVAQDSGGVLVPP